MFWIGMLVSNDRRALKIQDADVPHSGGMLFGMDTGIIGGVLKLDPFRA